MNFYIEEKKCTYPKLPSYIKGHRVNVLIRDISSLEEALEAKKRMDAVIKLFQENGLNNSVN